MKKRLSQMFFFMGIVLLCGCGSQEDEQQRVESYEAERSEEITVAMEETGEDGKTETEGEMKPEEETEMSEKRMTKEYIIEQNIFTEEELEGVDVEAILENHNWKEGDENRKTWKTFFLIEAEEQKIAAGLIETIDYSYLGELDSREDGLSKEELGSIITIAFLYQDGNYLESILLDKENGRMYMGKACDLLVENAIPTTAMDMEEDTWDTVVTLLDSCEVTEWKKRYQGTSEGTTGNFWWNLFIELENGEKCFYSGEGAVGPSTPEQYRELEHGLRGLFE